MKNIFLQSATVNGLLIGLALIILSLLDWTLGYYGQNTAFSILSYVVWIGGLTWSALAYRKQIGGYISYGQAFGYSMTVAVVYAIVAAIFSLLLMQVIDPNYMETVLAMTEETLLESGLSQSQVDALIEVSSKFMHPAITIISSLFITMLLSAIISLITSAFVKKTNTNPFAGSQTF
jgi:hypothetical protein